MVGRFLKKIASLYLVTRVSVVELPKLGHLLPFTIHIILVGALRLEQMVTSKISRGRILCIEMAM